MAQYSNLKAYIEEKIYENGTQAITGDILQDVLKVMTDDLGEFYQMGGVASPSTDPGTPDAKVIYFATEAGTYTNFGGITIEAGEVALLIFETSWTKETLNVLSSANGGVKTANLADGAVTTEKIAGGAVETAKIANNAVTSGKVADGAIGTAKIADGAIGADKIAANAVESAKIKNGAVTEGKINDGAVTAGKIASNAVTTDKIKDDAVTSDKIANNAVGNDQIASGAVHAGNIADGAVTAPKIGGGAVTSGKIGSGAVTEEKIADGAVTASKIADGAVGSDQLAEGAFSAQNLADGSVTTDKLADDAVTAEKIADGAVTADKFANGSVTTIKLGSGAVTTEKIGDGMVTRQKLADSSVGTSKIIDGAVTTDKVADGAITDAKLENPVSVSQNTLTIGGEYAGEVSTTYDVTLHSGETFESLEDLLSDEDLATLIPANVRKGGMTIKFVQTTDNKYVQYRLMADSWSINTEDWSIADEGVYVVNPEFVYVKTDAEDKILWAIRANGDIFYGAGVPQQIVNYINEKIAELSLDEYEDIVAFLDDLEKGDKTLQTLLDEKIDKEEGKSLIDEEYASSQNVVENQKFLEVKTDLESKILEATTIDGRKQFYIPIDTPVSSTDYADDVDWTEIHLNEDKKIISGTHKDGSTYIGQFDDKTKDTIKQVCSENYDFVIPIFDSEFSAPVPYKIFNGEVEDESVKGTDNAKYVFDLSLSKKAFNIRFKFRITENIYNEQKSCVVASLGLVPIVSAKPEKLVQHTTTVSYNGEDKTMYWPALKGGVSTGQNMSLQYSAINNNNLGSFAFYLKYSGTSHDVTIENDGSAFILKIDEVATTFSYSNYSTVQELYEALKAVADIEISCGGIEGRNCDELAIFEESKLVSLCYTRTDGVPTSSVEEYWDSAPFFIPYAIDETWHQVEVVKIQDNVYSVCDGNTTKIGSISNLLTLGGECGVLFKDLEVYCNTSADAEVTDLGIISGVCPNILVFEGHGMDTRPTCEIPNPSTSLVTTPDRLQYLFGFLKSKGYIPVSLKDVSEFYDGSKTLPKRCYVPVFDDYEFENCMELKNRSVFTGFGVKPALAIVTGYSSSHTITHNGTTITIQDAAAICKTYDFYLVSHTRNHRSCTSIKPSEYLDELVADVYDGDVKGIDNSILVYPFGNSNAYLVDSLKWVGYKLGIQVAPDSSFNKKVRSRYTIIRQELGLRNPLQDLLAKII